jgi:hypothetical protein
MKWAKCWRGLQSPTARNVCSSMPGQRQQSASFPSITIAGRHRMPNSLARARTRLSLMLRTMTSQDGSAIRRTISIVSLHKAQPELKTSILRPKVILILQWGRSNASASRPAGLIAVPFYRAMPRNPGGSPQKSCVSMHWFRAAARASRSAKTVSGMFLDLTSCLPCPSSRRFVEPARRLSALSISP